MNLSSANRARRSHSPEFKKELIALCQPGVSISGVALAHGVNANLLRRWLKQFPVDVKHPIVPTPAKLVPVQVETIRTSPTNEDIQFDIQRGSTRINIRWPLDKAEACAQWLGVWLK
jgi:transposase-like protein